MSGQSLVFRASHEAGVGTTSVVASW
jgi:hypothetical protein